MHALVNRRAPLTAVALSRVAHSIPPAARQARVCAAVVQLTR
jgi:hypothetical protein